MKICILLVLLLILLNNPAVSSAADTLDPGNIRMFDLPFFKVPLGSGSDSGGAKAEKGEGEARNDEAKEKERLDKKVDDAIKKAWEEK
ncbi:exported hypothetical protein [Syntrophobacter sp. SbD1]|nr:exported hypothetical protein [Syntrophobacter sp. SbD1]